MLDNNIKPELEVFDLGMLNYINVLIKKKLLQPPYYINIILGNMFTSQTNIHHLSAFLASLPENSIVSIGGLGQFQFKSNILGLLFVDGVRIGLEDNIYYCHEEKALTTNKVLVNRLIKQAELFNKHPFTRHEARVKILGL